MIRALTVTFLGILLLLLPLLPGRAAADGQDSWRLAFQGNAHLAESVLREAVAEELADFSRAEFPETMADDAAFLLESTYKKQGYAFAKVSYGIFAEPDGTRLQFNISEGVLVEVASLVIYGNSAFATDELLAFFAEKDDDVFGSDFHRFVESDIRDALAGIADFYKGEGFLRVAIDEPVFLFSEDRSRVEVRLTIQEGEKTTVGAIGFLGDILEEARPELDKLTADMTGKPLVGRRKLMLRSGVQEVYGNLGYPDAKIDIKEKRSDSSAAVDLVCTVISGPRVTIGAIRVSGNTRTETDFILQRLALQEGEQFSSLKKRESFRRLYQTGLFSKVAIVLAEGLSETERLLEVQVEETLSREIFFQAGWGSYEFLRGSSGFQDNNIFGSGRVFRAEVGGSIKSANVEAAIRDPWILGSDITADLPVFYRYREEPSFTSEEIGLSMLLVKDLRKDLSVTMGYLYSSTKTKDITALEVIAPESDYTVASIKLQTTLDNRNDIFFPTGGRKISAVAEIAEPSMGSGLSFYRFNFGARQFYPLGKKNTLALHYETGAIFPGRNQVIIPIGERFFNGGENTVRSFQESELGPKDSSGDPLGGLAFNVFSVEMRRLLTDRLAASLFMDYGNVAPNLSPEEDEQRPFTDRQAVIDRTLSDYFSDFRPGLGAGVQYLLPVGPARLDFAWNPAQDKDREEDNVTVHFSIGMAF